MASYQKPTDPRSSRSRASCVGLTLGIAVTIAALAVAFYLLRQTFTRPPLDIDYPTPTLLVLTAPPTVPPTLTPIKSTPTIQPTLTIAPTIDYSIQPNEVTQGYFAIVANTDGQGVRVRPEPTIGNNPLFVAPDGMMGRVLDGPKEGSDLTWYQIEFSDGIVGWIAAIYLEPAAQPSE